MNEFWSQDKLILIIGLFQFGLIFFMFAIVNLSKQNVSHDNSSKEIPTTAIAPNPAEAEIKVDNVNNLPITNSIKNSITTAIANSIATETAILASNNEIVPDSNIPENSGDPTLSNTPQSIPDRILETVTNPEIAPAYIVTIAPDLFTELLEISKNPAEMVDEAIRWWLRRRNLDSLDTTIDLDRRYRVGMRTNFQKSQQNLWND